MPSTLPSPSKFCIVDGILIEPKVFCMTESLDIIPVLGETELDGTGRRWIRISLISRSGDGRTIGISRKGAETSFLME